MEQRTGQTGPFSRFKLGNGANGNWFVDLCLSKLLQLPVFKFAAASFDRFLKGKGLMKPDFWFVQVFQFA